MILATRYHDFSAGHRVHGHESVCSHLHGHNYRIHFHVASPTDELDRVGRVVDFSVIKSVLCTWLEENWDHKFLAWERDELMRVIVPNSNRFTAHGDALAMLIGSVVWVPFNPTAENMADHLLRVVGPELLFPHNLKLVKVVVEETRKCSASAELLP